MALSKLEPLPSSLKGGFEFSKFLQKQGVTDFSHKKGGVEEKRGLFLKKWDYHLFSY